VASGKEIKIRDAITALLAKINFTGKLLFNGDDRMFDPKKWVADIGALQALGYDPATSLSVGLDKYVQWLSDEKLL
jgi:nucleoside-diphosphate-sugar epimerase